LKWWKNAIGYQINTRTFFDSNGDGIGDIQGIIKKIPYLKHLNIDFLWINPIFPTSNYDNGYDITNFTEINSLYGTMADFEKLIETCHNNNIKVTIDLVLNHSSNQHPWFLEAKKNKDSKYRDYYLWCDNKNNQLPNDWESFFGGSVWEYNRETNQYYFHTFSKYQPDFNWNSKELREEMKNIIEFWVDKGVDGFRLDAISHLKKASWNYAVGDNKWSAFTNVDGIREYLSFLKDIFNKYELFIFGEASGVSSTEACEWIGNEGFFDAIIELEHNYKVGLPGFEKIDLNHLKNTLSKWQFDLAESDGSNVLYIENHDTSRSISIMGNDTISSAKALATAFMLLNGVSIIYQGQEIGMSNYKFSRFNEIETIDTINKYNLLIGQGLDETTSLQIATSSSRDHSRTAMQWSSDSYAGFSKKTPKVLVNQNFNKINVEKNINDDKSLLNFYKMLIDLKKRYFNLSKISYYDLSYGIKDIFCYSISNKNFEMIVLVNLSDQENYYSINNIDFSKFKLLYYNIHNKDTNDSYIYLCAYECLIWIKDKNYNIYS